MRTLTAQLGGCITDHDVEPCISTAGTPDQQRMRCLATGLLMGAFWVSWKISFFNILLVPALCCWLVALWLGQARWVYSPMYLPLLGWIASTLLSTVFSENPHKSLGELHQILSLVMVPMVVSLLHRRHWNLLLSGLAGAAALTSIVGLVQYVQGASSLAHRLHGLSPHYMTFSGWVLVVVLLLIGDLTFSWSLRRLLWSIPVLGLCTTALLLSYTRNAWIGLIVGVLVVVIFWRPKVSVVLIPLGLVVAMVLPGKVVNRIASIANPEQHSNFDRLCMMRSGLMMVEDFPLLGVGVGMVKPLYPLYREDEAPRWQVAHLHSNPLHIAAERGVLGLGVYCWFLGMFGWWVYHLWHSQGRRGDPLLAGCLLVVVGITAAGLFEYNWGDSEVWMVTLLAMVLPMTSEREMIPSSQGC